MTAQSDGDRTSAPRPVLRWAGSKKQLLKTLGGYWSPSFERYIEPFCGSASLFFSLQPNQGILSDSNAELISFYEELRTDPTGIWRELISIPRTREVYERLRSIRYRKSAQHARAVRFLFLNRNCFNGLYRTNTKGEFNVPFAAARTGGHPSLNVVLASARALRNAEVLACDFGHTLKRAGKGDFVYMDPPFFVKARRVFRHYGPRQFVREDLLRLAEHLDKLDARGAKFVVSFADCAESRLLGADWLTRRVRVRRHIAGFSKKRRYSYERLISNIDGGGS